ncbi:MAG: ChaN family lipoprotein [Candidatus Cloacimonadales bacterium]|nr:ChaN family lipoprotein [Candidatus Cloacimonadales bacterium]
MKKILLVMLLLSSFLFAEDFDYKIIDSARGNELSIQGLAKELLKYNAAFFGELHDDALLHKLELELLEQIYSFTPEIAVSMEMFERDTQVYLDEYMNDEIGEEEFILAARAWPNYLTDYKPLIDFAKENKISVIAANIPRRYANLISKQGMHALDSLSIEEKKFISKRQTVFDDEYKERFMAVMQSNMEQMPENPMMGQMNFDLLYAAQCIKDETMAESMFNYIKYNRKKLLLHYNGDFHSRKHLGTAQKLQRDDPKLRIAVITPIVCEGELTFTDEDRAEGDFLILMKQQSKE